jgi:putative DNA primase/helicase
LGGKKPAKYLTAKGQKPDAIWLAMPDENYWMDVMDNADAIFITEGAKKAGAGLSIGLPTVAFTGVYNWVGDGIQQLAEHFGRFVSQSGSKTYYIAFDSDYETKPECVKAILMLGKALKKAGIKDVRVITWSQDYKGMDDYIKANGGDEFKKRVDMAVKIKEWEKQFKDDDDDIDSGKKRPRQNSKTVADDLVEKHRNDWAYHNEQKVWRIWNGKYWEEIDGDAFSQLVLNELEVKEVKISNPGFLKNVVEFLRLKLLVKKWLTFDRKRYIPFNNGVLDLGENKLLPHDTGYRFTHCLNRDYSPIESSGDILSDLKRHHPYGYDYIMQAASGHVDAALKMLAVLAGIVKWRFSELQKFVYIQGKPRSGKGTFIRLVTELIGRKNTQSSCLNKLSSEYEVAEIIDSQLVVFPD